MGRVYSVYRCLAGTGNACSHKFWHCKNCTSIPTSSVTLRVNFKIMPGILRRGDSDLARSVAWVCDCARPWQPPHAVWQIRLFSLRQSTASPPKSLFACTSFGWNVVRECVLNSWLLLSRNVSWVRQNRIFFCFFSVVLRCPTVRIHLAHVHCQLSNSIIQMQWQMLVVIFSVAWFDCSRRSESVR